MRKQDLFKLPLGIHELVDNIGNYFYTMNVALTKDGERCYRIKEKGSISMDSIFMIECYVNEEGEDTSYHNNIRYKDISAIAGVGGLSVHSKDNFRMLNELNIIPKGSFKQFIENTNNNF